QADPSPGESARIERFLTALGEREDLVFIRNGSEYGVDSAVSHLRRKLRGARERITTAEEFVDHVASVSSSSGRPYLVRRPGGKDEPAGPYFRELLEETDRASR
ncbi:MAG: DUF5329 family protein, partial [Deltaproteobacteria bacterium]|nr:DUF5329 family protein [Deltaproteobacteria bacterium]